jgi:pimeloyl-ACP methyl ester carboxylesterase
MYGPTWSDFTSSMGAGHWVQLEQPERVSELLLQFLRDSAKR